MSIRSSPESASSSTTCAAPSPERLSIAAREEDMTLACSRRELSFSAKTMSLAE